MSYLEAADEFLQSVRGGFSSMFGQPYDVRRLSNTTNVSVASNSPVISGFQASLTRTDSKKFLENQIFELIAFLSICDNTQLELMDQMTETGYEAMPQGTYVCAQIRPLKQTIWIRTESQVGIYRPMPTAIAEYEQPVTGTVYHGDGEWSGVARQDEYVLTLVNGEYSFQAPGATPAQVAFGLAPNARFREGDTLNQPTEQYKDQFIGYLPLLPGAALNREDIIDLGNGTRYEIAKFYSSQQTGLAGIVMTLENLAEDPE